MAGGFRNLAFCPPHNSRQCDRLFTIGDDQGIRFQLQFGAIQAGERFAFFRSTYDDFFAGQQVPVKCVQRLAVFHHHEVCDIHNIIDGTKANSSQPVFQPFR